jgi:DNA replication ATP-dependent helicase Dna2
MREDSIHIELNESDLIDGDEGICADIWESTHSVDICRRNLMALFASEPTLTGVRLRELVVDMAPPRFDPLPPASSVNIAGDLNEDQMLAMRTAACALDYMLLLGMPGTGKTTTIAAMIKAMVADGQTILIASYTHTAVDNLCLKLIELGVEFIRIGRAESFHSDVARYALETIVEGASGVDDISKAIDYCRVFATTCLGFQHPVIQSRIYDLCVIDEASQINLPTVLGPLSRSRRFILVGDHYQLSPIKKHDAAMHEDAPSLFRVLCEAHPHALVTLRTQYRMNAEIMRLCNELIYGFRMRCGISAVARGRLSLARLEVFTRFEMFHQNWIRFALESEPPVLFYDTDPVPMHERRGQGSKVNHGEAAVASAIVVALVLCGLDPSQIGVISPYRAQVLYMRDAVTKQLQSVAKFFPHLVPDVKQLSDAIECHTVDKFQGRDKECILFSSVKSNRRLNPGNHITDWQRLNVAVTRAKTKFILIGSRETLSRAPVFSDLFKLLSPQNVVLLPNEIDQANAQPFGAMPMIANPHGDES